MKRGFFTIMSAQFFSSLADQALLVGAIELLKSTHAPAWQIPALGASFTLFYVVLAPFVGAFADAVPKGKVMFYSNLVKIVGCLMMLFGAHPLMSYAIVGLGAAAYSPAKYGHPHRAAAALATGQGQWLDRGPDDRVHHPGPPARRPTGRAAQSRRYCWALTSP